MRGQPRIAERLDLEFRIVHRDDMTVRLGPLSGGGISGQNLGRPNGSSVSQARSGRSTARQTPTAAKEAITLIGLNPFASAALCLLQTTTRGPRCDLRSTVWTRGPRSGTDGRLRERFAIPDAIPANAQGARP